MVAEIGRSPLRVLRTSKLFLTQARPPAPPYLSNYVVSRDGERFLVKVPLALPESHPITMTTQWVQKLAGMR